MEFISASLAETSSVGEALGSVCAPGDVICLGGDLGAGKTTMAQAIARGVGVAAKEYVSSPTFAILHEYHGRLTIYHMDFYRLGSSDDVVGLGLDEYLYGEGLSLIEWYERAETIIPKSSLIVKLLFLNHTSRKISFESGSSDWDKRLKLIHQTLPLS